VLLVKPSFSSNDHTANESALMNSDGLLLLRGPDVSQLLEGRRGEVIDAVRAAYCEHQSGHSFLPHSVFVRFPGREKERIIALPGYLGGSKEVAGVKWIASFPKNVDRGMSRASALIVLNSLDTGRPHAVLEGSLVSAARTAASAALAADVLHEKGEIDVLGVIGCGVINREIVRYVGALRRKVGSLVLYDTDTERAGAFGRGLAELGWGDRVEIAGSAQEVLRRASVISFATTAVQPTVPDLSVCRPAATILHISLRDLTPDAVLAADNVVDDVDHVLRAQTSLHLAQQQVGHHDFVRCSLAEVLMGMQPARRNERTPVVFSPFGLGVLDLAVAQLIVDSAAKQGAGVGIQGFFDGT
jgi:2,3-diaminopropionate biosynthesis protein SbnB